MSAWPTRKLGDLLRIQNGFAFKSELFNDEGKGIPIIRIRDLARGFSETFYSGEHDPSFEGKDGDFLIGMDGEFRCYRWGGGRALVNQRVCRLHNFSDELNPSYVFYGINDHLRKIEDNTSFVTVKHLSAKQIAAIEMPVPPLTEQQRIVKLLDEADTLRKQRAQADRRTAALIGALFHEMFETPGRSQRILRKHKLAELCDSPDDIRCGPFGTQLLRSEYRTSGVPLWGIKHVNSHFTQRAVEFLSKSKAADLENYSLLPGDVVMTRKATVGNCAVYPETFQPGIMHSDLLRVRVSRSLCTPDFLSFALAISGDVKQQVDAVSAGATTRGINVSMLKQIAIHLPLLPLQEEFTHRVAEIRKLQTTQSASRACLDALFQSMLHRAFNGEL